MSTVDMQVDLLMYAEPLLITVDEVTDTSPAKYGVLLVYAGGYTRLLCTNITDAYDVRNKVLEKIPAELIENKVYMVSILTIEEFSDNADQAAIFD
jgi:hypothetical protein